MKNQILPFLPTTKVPCPTALALNQLASTPLLRPFSMHLVCQCGKSTARYTLELWQRQLKMATRHDPCIQLTDRKEQDQFKIVNPALYTECRGSSDECPPAPHPPQEKKQGRNKRGPIPTFSRSYKIKVIPFPSSLDRTRGIRHRASTMACLSLACLSLSLALYDQP